MAKKSSRDPVQDGLDREDAILRLAELRAAMHRHDAARAALGAARAALHQAIRLEREAGWDVGLLLTAERRRSVPPSPIPGSAEDNYGL